MMLDQPNNKTITQEDVARRAGVSRSVVSYVINNGPRNVSDETRTRVLTAIKELEYRPNKHARMLSSTDTLVAEKYIGIVLAGIYMFKRPYYGSILASIHEYAHENDCHIRFIRVLEDFNNPALFNELIHPNEINGVILIGLDQILNTVEVRDLIGEIVRRVEHVVCVDWEWPGVPSIQFDRQKAAAQATHHLLATGRTKVIYLGPDDNRVAGYQQVLREWGNGVGEPWIGYAADIRSGYEQCQELIGAQISVDAICAGTDEVAIGILKCLHEHRIKVPVQIAVASIDNLEWSSFTIPSLTTIDVPKHEIGFHAIDILLSGKARRGSTAFTITLPTQLIVRESSSQRAR